MGLFIGNRLYYKYLININFPIGVTMDIVIFGKMLFYACMIPLIVYSLKFYAISISSIFYRYKSPWKASKEPLPKITVQIPVYNDPVVVECVKKCMAFDYPKDKYEIIVIDDSTDGKTAKLLKDLKKTQKDFKIMRRGSRRGFKAGALNDATKISRGDIIVVFDSDYRPKADFLRKVVQPFLQGRNIAFVQTRWDYLNPTKNRISRLAMTSYSAFHQCSMPIKEKLGTAIFCGTGGAIRKNVLVEAGGWNEKNIGEDIDLTIRILKKGYSQAYLPYVKVKGEVPETLKAFVKQQERWAYGTTKVMKDYLGGIIKSSELSRTQKIDMVFITTGFMVFPFILGVTLSTMIVMAPWFGPNTTGMIFDMASISRSLNLALTDLFSWEGIAILALSCGYIFECAVATIKTKNYRNLTVLPYIFFVGFIVQVTNTIAVFKALFGVEQGFYKTPKASYKGFSS
jgi:cellulose synthase/poly-beta-1,6-N-acetylglucosamine synthase-like glycosyltransferase